MKSTGKRKTLFASFLRLILIIAVICGVLFGFRFVQKEFYPRKYSDYVSRYANQYEVDEALVFAVINCESGFEPTSVSAVGAKGLMQLTNETFDWIQKKEGSAEILGPEHLFEPEVSIKYGTALLKRHLDEFGSVRESVAAYHAGAANVRNWLKSEKYSSDGKTLFKIPYSDTSVYVDKVEKHMEKYTKLYYAK